MGTGFKHGAGGGNPLNFKVVGNPQPSNPKENTIWVDTDEKITGYIFSATQPTGATGMVWISVGASSSVAFNALKKNNITVYPISAKQYIGGSWVEKSAKSWQGGEWVDWWNGELYKAGNEYVSITGGWIASDTRSHENTPGVLPSLTKNDSNMEIRLNSAVGGGRGGSIRTSNKVRLDSFTKITMEYSINSSLDGNCALVVSPTIPTYLIGNSVAYKAIEKTATTVEHDISGLTGEFYIFVCVTPYNGSSAIMNVFEIVLK